MEILGIDSRWLYLGLVGLVVLERVGELILTRRNAARLRTRGGFDVGRGHFLPMALLHGGLLAAAPLEVLLLDRPLIPPLAITMVPLVTATMALRYWAVSTLGDRWTAQVWVVPGEAPVEGGPYRWLRHPNYVAVIGEVALLLIHSAWGTALAFSIANAVLLRVRIRVEEEALENASGYLGTLGDLPRLVPGSRRS